MCSLQHFRVQARRARNARNTWSNLDLFIVLKLPNLEFVSKGKCMNAMFGRSVLNGASLLPNGRYKMLRAIFRFCELSLLFSFQRAGFYQDQIYYLTRGNVL